MSEYEFYKKLVDKFEAEHMIARKNAEYHRQRAEEERVKADLAFKQYMECKVRVYRMEKGDD